VLIVVCQPLLSSCRASPLDYEAYLKEIEKLIRRVNAGKAEDTAERLKPPGLRALYSNLGREEALAIRIHEAILQVRPDAWRGVPLRENKIKQALFQELTDKAEVERVFLIIQQRKEVLMAVTIKLGAITVDVTRKNIKNVHLPEDGTTFTVVGSKGVNAGGELVGKVIDGCHHLAFRRTNGTLILQARRFDPAGSENVGILMGWKLATLGILMCR